MNSEIKRNLERVTPFLDRLFALLLYLLPHHLLSQFIHWVTRLEWIPLKNALINGVMKIYRIDLSSAVEQDIAKYSSFNAFFTRALDAAARPVAEDGNCVVSPVDGRVSQAGKISNGRLIQAKGVTFSLQELLGGDDDLGNLFTDGSFATLYLSPQDYHRIHMPLEGKLQQMIHVPGRLFSVSPSTTRTVPRLFSRNERIVNLFQTKCGPVAVIMVGAIFVASMDTVWAGTVTPLSRKLTRWHYTELSAAEVKLSKGEELGRFNMGSTVILLFPRDAVTWEESLQPGTHIRMGECIGRLGTEPGETVPTG
jgi:phosphatidylserine decarboxylase